MSSKKQTVCVIGLGYVGLPLAVRCSQKGYETLGLDLDAKKVALINKKKSPFKEKYIQENLSKYPIKASSDEKIIRRADVVLVCVPTPVDKNHYPDLRPVTGATKAIACNIKKGALMVLESTVNPGVSEEIIEPILKNAKLKPGKDYFLAHCPERINPGDSRWNVTNIPRIVGATNKAGLKKVAEFYRTIVDAPIREMRSIREAEAVKIVENSFRDINIAFVNELAKSFSRMKIDTKDVILGAATKPFSFLPHFPACGVGGHCIPVDPYYLIERAKKAGFDHKLLRSAREINNSMPEYTVELLQDALNEIGLPMKDTSVGLLGVAYKADVDDIRESPSLKIAEAIKKHKSKLLVFDPYIPRSSNVKNLTELLKKSEAVILATDHKEFREITTETFQKYNVKAVVDGKNCLNKKALEKLGILYRGIGR